MKYLFRCGVVAVALALAGCGALVRSPAPEGYSYLTSRAASGTSLYNKEGQLVGTLKGRDARHRFAFSKKRKAAVSILMSGQTSPIWVEESKATSTYLTKN